MPYFIDLSSVSPLFRGTTRRVYGHPQDSSLLIKVPSPQEEERRLANRPQWKRRFKPTGIANITNLREMSEMLRLNLHAKEADQSHIFSYIGMIPTNYGWGQIVQAEYDEHGNYAPSLEQIAHNYGAYQQPLQEFIRWAETTNMIFIDLEPWNCVLAHRNGKKEIVIIDGIGEKNVIPFRTYFPSLNKKKNAKQIAQFLQRLKQIKHGQKHIRRQA